MPHAGRQAEASSPYACMTSIRDGVSFEFTCCCQRNPQSSLKADWQAILEAPLKLASKHKQSQTFSKLSECKALS